MAAVASLAVVTALAACGSGSSTNQPAASSTAPQSVDLIRLAGADYGYPSPFTYLLGPGLVDVNFLFDTLLWKDSSGQPIPWLATSWSHSADAREWRMTLHQNVKFSDGTPLTSDDVVFTYNYFLTGAGKVNPGVFGPLPPMTVTADGPAGVVFKLTQPIAPFEITVAGRVPILPKHIWASVTDPLKFKDPSAVIGSGPYKLASYDAAAGSYDFVANMDYFMGPPYVRRIEFVPAPDAVLALSHGAVDSASPSFDQGVTAGTLAPFETDSKYSILRAQGENTVALHFNMSRGFPYNDVRFRQAIADVIDRNDLVKRILLGEGGPGSMGGMAPSNPYFASGLPTYDLNLAQARQLLDAIGLKVNESGVRTLPNGQPFTPQLLTTSRWNPKITDLVKEYLAAVGIQVNVVSVDYPTFNASSSQAKYDLALVAYGGLGGDPDYLRQRYSSRIQAAVFSRAFGYQNPTFDSLADQQLVTMDAAQRTQIVKQMQQIIAQDVPTIDLYVANRVQISVASVFDAWYYTPGGVFGGYPGVLNKHVFVTGRKLGFAPATS